MLSAGAVFKDVCESWPCPISPSLRTILGNDEVESSEENTAAKNHVLAPHAIAVSG